MRITLSLKYDTILRNIERDQEELSRLSTQIASGRQLQKPSDDPFDWTRSENLQDTLRQLGTFKDNIDYAISLNGHTATALDELYDLLNKAKDLGIRSVSASSRENASELNQIIEEMVRIANDRFRGRYLFGGNSNVEPFTITEDSAGNVVAVSDFQAYTPSDQWAVEVRVGKGQKKIVNVDGREVFLEDRGNIGSPDGNIFQHLVNLKSAMANGDTKTISSEIKVIEDALKRINSCVSVVGARLSSLQERKDLLSRVEIAFNRLLSDSRDVDIPSAVVDLKLKQTALEAALSTASMLNRLSLNRFL